MQKGNQWRRLFRKGYNANYPKGMAAKYNGTMAKTDAHTNKQKLKRYLDNVDQVNIDE